MHEVGGIGILHPPVHPIGMNQRSIELHELPPSSLVPRITNANEQSRASEGWSGHWRPSSFEPWRKAEASNSQIIATSAPPCTAPRSGRRDRSDRSETL